MSGTTPMEPKTGGLSSREVCTILRVCAETQVTELEFSGLRVKRDRPVEQIESMLPENPAPLPIDLAEAQEKIGRETLESDASQLQEDRLAELAITNPVEYERLLASGELEHDGA